MGKKREPIPSKIKDKCRSEVFHICPICLGKKNSLGLEIHHIDQDRNNNEENNLIALCGSCHEDANNLTVTERSLKDIKTELNKEDKSCRIEIFRSLVIEQEGHEIRHRFMGKGNGSNSMLGQSIDMIEFGLVNHNWTSRERIEILFKLVNMKRLYGMERVKNISANLKIIEKEIINIREYWGKFKYESGYIDYLNNCTASALKKMSESIEYSDSSAVKANTRIIQEGIKQYSEDYEIDNKKFENLLCRVMDIGKAHYQSALQHLINKYVNTSDFDRAEETIRRFETFSSGGNSGEMAVLDYYKGIIAFKKANYTKSIDLFNKSINKKKRFGTLERISEIYSYLGLAYEAYARDGHGEKYIDHSLYSYKQGQKIGRARCLANVKGVELCSMGEGRLLEKYGLRKERGPHKIKT